MEGPSLKVLQVLEGPSQSFRKYVDNCGVSIIAILSDCQSTLVMHFLGTNRRKTCFKVLFYTGAFAAFSMSGPHKVGYI